MQQYRSYIIVAVVSAAVAAVLTYGITRAVLPPGPSYSFKTMPTIPMPSTTTTAAPAVAASSTLATAATTASPLANLPGFKRPADLATLLPPSLPGYGAPQVQVSAQLVHAVYTPNTTGTVRSVTITIADQNSSAGAVGFVNDVVAKYYAADPSQILLAPDIRAYFGTSGTNYATVGWAKGTLGYQVLIEIGAGKPRSFRADVRRIAKQVG